MIPAGPGFSNGTNCILAKRLASGAVTVNAFDPPMDGTGKRTRRPPPGRPIAAVPHPAAVPPASTQPVASAPGFQDGPQAAIPPRPPTPGHAMQLPQLEARSAG